MEETQKGIDYVDLWRKNPPPTAPFERLLSLKEIPADNGDAALYMPFKKEYANSYGILHGGAIASLADTAAAVALSKRYPDGGFLTIEANVKYLQKASTGLTAVANVDRCDGKTCAVNVEIYDENKKVVAAAVFVFYIKGA